MTAEGTTPDPFDRLARAEAALRAENAPAGPSEDLVARTRASLRDADDRVKLSPLPWRSPMIAVFKFALAALVVSMTAALAYLAGMSRVEATTTFVEAAKKLQDARTISYQVSVRLPDQEKPTVARKFYKDPGLIRTESDAPQEAVTIIDLTRGKVLTLDPKTKLAFFQDWKIPDPLRKRSPNQAAEMAKYLRSLANKDGKPVGKRKVGAVEAEGFRVDKPEGLSWTLWVDADRKFPLLMETSYRLNDREIPATLSDFRLDAPLDDALFRLEPPAGYKLRKVDLPIVIREEALINLLRLYAEASEGTFPPQAR